MNTEKTPVARAVNIKCPPSFKTYLQGKFGDCFYPSSQLNDEIKNLDKTHTIYRFEDCFTVFQKNKPVVINALVSVC